MIDQTDLTPFRTRKSPLQVLRVLSTAVGPMARKTIAELSGLKMENGRVPSETNTYKFLTTGGYIREEELTLDDDHTETVYSLTKKGREILKECENEDRGQN